MAMKARAIQSFDRSRALKRRAKPHPLKQVPAKKTTRVSMTTDILASSASSPGDGAFVHVRKA